MISLVQKEKAQLRRHFISSSLLYHTSKRWNTTIRWSHVVYSFEESLCISTFLWSRVRFYWHTYTYRTCI